MLKGLGRKLSKLLKGEGKGFTLVELMIVIAVIAILALVLIPRVGLIKNKAKESGLEMNLNVISGEVHSVIDKFNGPGETDALEARIAKDLNNAIDEQKMKNPVTQKPDAGNDTVITTGKSSLTGGEGAGVIDTADDGADEAQIDTVWTTTEPTAKGMIVIAAWHDTSLDRLVVTLIPYDSNGNRLDEMVRKIYQ